MSSSISSDKPQPIHADSILKNDLEEFGMGIEAFKEVLALPTTIKPQSITLIDDTKSAKISKKSLESAEGEAVTKTTSAATRAIHRQSMILEDLGAEPDVEKGKERSLSGRQVKVAEKNVTTTDPMITKDTIGPVRSMENEPFEEASPKSGKGMIKILEGILPQNLKAHLRKYTPEQRMMMREALPIETKSLKLYGTLHTQHGQIDKRLKETEARDKATIDRKQKFHDIFSRSSESSRLKRAGFSSSIKRLFSRPVQYKPLVTENEFPARPKKTFLQAISGLFKPRNNYTII